MPTLKPEVYIFGFLKGPTVQLIVGSIDLLAQLAAKGGQWGWDLLIFVR
jgi:hypothetical protein